MDGLFSKEFALNKTNTASDIAEMEDAENAKLDTMSTPIMFADHKSRAASIKTENAHIVNYHSKCIQSPKNVESMDVLKLIKKDV